MRTFGPWRRVWDEIMMAEGKRTGFCKTKKGLNVLK